MLHVNILYNVLQKWSSNAVQHSLDNCTKSVTEIKESLSAGESETETGPPKKRLKSNNTPLAKEAYDLMILQAKEHFQKTNHLMSFDLIDPEQVHRFKVVFPDEQLAVKCYPMLCREKLRSELKMLYSSSEFERVKTVSTLRKV
ncbi:UNVERIFIED_CONTAM: hypothetical protein FKN15_008272 [Acipenser sinensis]